MYISDKPFEELGFKTKVPKRSVPSYTSPFMTATPIFGFFWLVVLSFLYYFTKPRLAEKEEKKTSQPSE
jgi:formate dehydrogenase iron-sulfur subunit